MTDRAKQALRIANESLYGEGGNGELQGCGQIHALGFHITEAAGGGHGGNLLAARRAYPLAPEPWLDLSTGVNPHAYPFGFLPQEAFKRLPEPEELCALEAAAAQAYRVPAHAEVIAAPGTQAIINWLPRLLPARRAGILGFSYYEHARSWALSGAEISVAGELSALKDQDVAIAVNPNNPDGRLAAARDLLALAAALGERGGLLIADEAFIDFLEPGASIVPDLPARGAIVLRSFGKTYGLPGLRLGFAIAPMPVAQRLRAALGPWPVPGAAIAIGKTALLDSEWLQAIRVKLEADTAALDEILSAAGFDFAGGSLLFRLVRHGDARSKFEHLASCGILVRRFPERPEWLRFGVPASDDARARLRAALALR
jgi:cobalamin biosynthetic protein CobC